VLLHVRRDILLAQLPEQLDRRLHLNEIRTTRRADRGVLLEAATLGRCETALIGLTQSEIATTLGIATGTVKSRTFNALARLGKALSQMPELIAVC
jgi:hypothetical protein